MTPLDLHIGKKISPAIAAAALSLAVAGCATNNTDTAQTPVLPSDDASSSSTVSSMIASAYEDGTYSAIGNYTSPAGAEEVDVTVTLADGVITVAEFQGKATHPTSQKLQGKFSEGFAEEVVGKNIDDVSLTVVNGSSLAPKGFMNALAKIKAEARG